MSVNPELVAANINAMKDIAAAAKFKFYTWRKIRDMTLAEFVVALAKGDVGIDTVLKLDEGQYDDISDLAEDEENDEEEKEDEVREGWCVYREYTGKPLKGEPACYLSTSDEKDVEYEWGPAGHDVVLYSSRLSAQRQLTVMKRKFPRVFDYSHNYGPPKAVEYKGPR